MKQLALTVLLAMVSVLAFADEPVTEEVTVKCNWGTLTMTAIKAGFPQGQHSSDPSGDGRGPDDADQPRKGLGNVITQGSLQATCEFIESQL